MQTFSFNSCIIKIPIPAINKSRYQTFKRSIKQKVMQLCGLLMFIKKFQEYECKKD